MTNICYIPHYKLENLSTIVWMIIAFDMTYITHSSNQQKIQANNSLLVNHTWQCYSLGWQVICGIDKSFSISKLGRQSQCISSRMINQYSLTFGIFDSLKFANYHKSLFTRMALLWNVNVRWSFTGQIIFILVNDTDYSATDNCHLQRHYST